MMKKKDGPAELLQARWKKGDDALREDRRNYWLNAAFFEGHQWVTWDPNRNLVNNFAVPESESERVRLTINKIQERVNQLVGRLVQRNLSFEGSPTNADDGTLEASRLASAILDAERVE